MEVFLNVASNFLFIAWYIAPLWISFYLFLT